MALTMIDIRKSFGRVRANDGITFEAKSGEVHALLGENGAGKTTLMKILAGFLQPDSGRIELDGATVRFRSPRQALRHGIAMISQQPQVAAALSVYENLVAGLALPFGSAASRAAAVRHIDACGFTLDLDEPAGELPLGRQKQLEIVRALLVDASTLVFDEPTDVLTPTERDAFFVLISRLAAEHRTIILITHFLSDAITHAQRITILRRGRTIATLDSGQTRIAELARLMVGELSPPGEREPDAARSAGRIPALELDEMRTQAGRGRRGIAPTTLSIASGEIVGVAGVSDNGQDELIAAITGRLRTDGGTIRVAGEVVAVGDTRRLIRGDRLGYVPPDRALEGLVGTMSLADNAILEVFDRQPWSRWGLLNRTAIRNWAKRLFTQHSIRPPDIDVRAETLSGGNQQKVILARVLDRRPALLIASNPTRGLDVGASRWVWERLQHLRGTGSGILLLSGDLDELKTLSDRIHVMFRGRLSEGLQPAAASSERIGALMGGAGADAEASVAG